MDTRKAIRFGCVFFLIIFLGAACQKINPPKDAEIIEIPPPLYEDVLARHVGEFVKFYGEIEIPSNVLCTEKIKDDDACPLHLTGTEHILNIIAGLNRNNVTYSGDIIYSDGNQEDSAPFGTIPAVITGLVKECGIPQKCSIDVYQLDAPAE